MLDDSYGSAEVNAVVQVHKTAQQNMVDKSAIAAHLAVVTHMRAYHDQVVVFHGSRRMILPAAMDGNVLTDPIAITNREHASRLMFLKVLGSAANDSPLTNLVFATQSRSRLDGNSGCQLTIVADYGPGFDDAKGPDADVSTEFSATINGRCRVNLSHSGPSSGKLRSKLRSRGPNAGTTMSWI
jgi:hypothetical protein